MLIPYPGGKHYARRIIASRLPLCTSEIVSPFIGGGSVELFLEARGVRVFGSDLFTPLVALWKQALMDPCSVAEIVETEYMPPSRARYEVAARCMVEETWDCRQAAAAYAAYRMAFSGRVGIQPGNSYSGHKFRLTSRQIAKLRSFRAPGLTVERMDWRDALEAKPSHTAYLDPPYPGQSKELYRGHRRFDWASLGDALRHRPAPWLLSMPDLPEVREQYGWARIDPVTWQATMRHVDGRRPLLRELLISNY